MPTRPKWTFAQYTRRQQLTLWGLLTLAVLIFALGGLLTWSPAELAVNQDLLQAAEQLRTNDTEEPPSSRDVESRSTASNSRPASTVDNKVAVERFSFDPNTVSQTELQRLGLQEYQAKAWVRYREAGAQFRKAEDISRLRVLKPEDVERLLPLVSLPDTESTLAVVGVETPSFERVEPARADDATLAEETTDEEETSRTSGTAAASPSTYSTRAPINAYSYDFTVDANTASEAELQQLRGIGPYWAGRIVKFRDALGGFVEVAQIGTTYGFPDSTFQDIKKQLVLSPLVDQIPINTATEDELKAHPYINRNLARILVNYRSQHGPFGSADDLVNIRILTQEGRERLIPYLTF